MTSIHPRVSRGGTKSNTCAPRKSGKPLKQMERLLRRQAVCKTIRDATKKPDAYKMPGSMNQHKCYPRGRRAR